MAVGDFLGALARGVGAGALGYGQGQVRGEAEAFRRQQLQQTREDRKAREKELIELKRLALEQQKQDRAAKLAADQQKPFRSSIGRIAERLARERGNAELQSWFRANPAMAQAYDAAIQRGLGIQAGSIDADENDMNLFSGLEANLPGGAAPDGGTVTPQPGDVIGERPGGFLAQGQGAATFSLPDLPALAPGAAFQSPGGGSFVPSLATRPTPAPAAPDLETPKQHEVRLKREAAAAKEAARKPLTLAQAALAGARAKKATAEVGEVPLEGTSKRKLRTAQATKASAEAGVVGKKVDILGRRADTDARRQKEQAANNQRVAADRTRRTIVAELNGAATRGLTAARSRELTTKIAKATGAMSEIDKRKWQYYAKNAIRTTKGKGGKSTTTVDPTAVDGLETLMEKYKSPAPGGSLGTRSSFTKPPPDVDADDWRTVTGLIDKGQFGAFLDKLPANHPRRIEAKKLFRLYEGREYKPGGR